MVSVTSALGYVTTASQYQSRSSIEYLRSDSMEFAEAVRIGFKDICNELLPAIHCIQFALNKGYLFMN